MSAFKINDLVWAKMKGFPPWPGVITEPTKELKAISKKNGIHHCIFFFGTHNYSWIEASNLKSYLDFKDDCIKANKSSGFKAACEEIEKYIEKGPSIVFSPPGEVDAFDQLVGGAEGTPSGLKTPKKLKGILKKPSLTPSNNKVTIKNDVRPRRSRTPKREFPLTKRVSTEATEVKAKRRYTSSISSDADSTLPDSQEDSIPTFSSPTYRKSPGANLLHRPANITKPTTPALNLETVSETLLQKKIEPSTLQFGFLGLGNIGGGVVKNLLNSKHKVTVWNRSPEKSAAFEKAGAEVALTPSDVVSASDITFSCVSNPQVAKTLVFGNCGVLSEMAPGKSLVEMSGIGCEDSLDIAEAVTSRGGKYLEVRLHGSKPEAEEGTLIILAAGDRSLYSDCESCFNAFGKSVYFLGEIGNAAKMYTILQLLTGITLCGLAECMALAERSNLPLQEFSRILNTSLLHSPFITDKSQAMLDCNYGVNMSLANLQKDLKLAMNLGELTEHPLPLGATANEHFKHAKKLGYGDHDASAIFVGAKF